MRHRLRVVAASVRCRWQQRPLRRRVRRQRRLHLWRRQLPRLRRWQRARNRWLRRRTQRTRQARQHPRRLQRVPRRLRQRLLRRYAVRQPWKRWLPRVRHRAVAVAVLRRLQLHQSQRLRLFPVLPLPLLGRARISRVPRIPLPHRHPRPCAVSRRYRLLRLPMMARRPGTKCRASLLRLRLKRWTPHLPAGIPLQARALAHRNRQHVLRRSRRRLL